MNFCPKCGTRVTDEMLFCYKCGDKLTLDFNPPMPSPHVEVPPVSAAQPYRNANPMDVPPPPSYRNTSESGYPQPNISSSNSDGYLSPSARGFGNESTNYTRTSRVTEDALSNPQLSNSGPMPPPLIPASNTTERRKWKIRGNFFKKVNPFKPKKHFLITLLILAGIIAGFYFFYDASDPTHAVSGLNHDVIFEWDIKRGDVIQRLNSQKIQYSNSDDPAGVIVAELYNSTIDFPIKTELVEDKKLSISYFFNSIGKLRSISIVVPQILKEDINPLSLKIGESYTLDPTNSKPNEFAYITDQTKTWLIFKNGSGGYGDAVITLSGRQTR
ncbi:MAG: zinc ribbon domain-containing protein [Ignavibacteriales bacterium]|nr:zinc ribbon domain-containing protein [Ignavibacteriales bacterium]